MSYQNKMRELEAKKKQLQNIASIVNAKERSIKERESLLKQGQRTLGRGMGNAPEDLIANIRNAAGMEFSPGNIGDINSVIWPFYFPTEKPLAPIAVNETFETGFSVTQEAAFIFMSFVKTVHQVEDFGGPGESWTYLDPDIPGPSAPGLTFTLRDGSSSRQLFNTPMNVDLYGNPRFPTIYPRPIMLLPNQVMQVAFTNSQPVNEYFPQITAFGYRIRIDQARKLLSLVYG